jgi:phosphohistidine swiveling domain-containing protein/DNA-binding transcriptional ArsR family regulator
MNRLFRSQTCFAVLSFLAKHKNDRFYLHQLAKETKLDPANVNRELKKLVAQSFVIAKREGRRVYYRLSNQPSLVHLFALAIQPPSTTLAVPEGKWVCGLDMDKGNHLFARCWVDGFVGPLEVGGEGHSQVFASFERDRFKFYFNEDGADQLAVRLADQFFMRADTMGSVLSRLQEKLLSLNQFAHLLPQEGVSQATSEDLWNRYHRHKEGQRALYSSSFVMLAVESEWKRRAVAWLSKRMAKPKALSVDVAFSVLSRPSTRTAAEEEQESLLRIAARIQSQPETMSRFYQWHESRLGHGFTESDYVIKTAESQNELGSFDQELLRGLETHHQRFSSLGFATSRKLRPFLSLVSEIARLVYHDNDCAATLERLKERRDEHEKKRAEYVSDFGLSQEEDQCFRLWGEWQASKQERRLVQEYALYKIQPVLGAIANRLSLTLQDLEVMLDHEVEAALLKAQPVNHLELGHRRMLCVYVATPTGGRYAVGEEAISLLAGMEKQIAHTARLEVRGVTARRGTAKGRVRLILTEQDVQSILPGEIIVAELLRPELVLGLDKAAALITDQGGLTSHAAIIAREQGIPCLVGTKDATKTFASGMRVHLDADRGFARLLNNSEE